MIKRERMELVELKKLMKDKDVSVNDIAEACDIHPESVRDRLSGKVDFYSKELFIVSKLLNISMDDLMVLIYK